MRTRLATPILPIALVLAASCGRPTLRGTGADAGLATDASGAGGSTGVSFAGDDVGFFRNGGSDGGFSGAGGSTTGGDAAGMGVSTVGDGFNEAGGADGVTTDAGIETAATCRVPTCTMACPLGLWKELDGCDSCACVPPESRMNYAGQGCLAESIALAVTASRESAAVNRWVLNFKWMCTAPSTSGGYMLSSASATVAIVDMATRPINSANRTIPFPLDSASPPTEFRQSELLLSGGPMPPVTLPITPGSGTYLSIRREADRFVGGLFLAAVVDISTGKFSGQFAGSFDVPVPR